MSLSKIKTELHSIIDLIEDEVELEILREAAEAYIVKQPDIIDLLAPEQLKRLEGSIEQADQGHTIAHDEVIKISRQWLKGNTQ